MTVLFVNACLRGEQSRTLTLCREYLEGVDDVEEVNLAELKLEPYYGPSAAYRAQLEAKGLFDDPMFDIGKDFAEADEIVIGAPYWDLSFPAALKIYIEHAAVMGMTFHYTEEGRCEGLCRAKHLTYIKIKNDSKNIKGNIAYKVRMAGKGWTGWKKNGQKAGNGKTKNAVQALKVQLTGELGKQYNVFYRAYVVGYGWTGWGKNGEQVGAPKLAGIRAYQVKIAPKKGTAAKKANKKYNTKKARKNHLITTKTASEMSMRLSMAAKAQGQSSKTKWLILVDTHKNRVCVLKGKRGQWNVHKFFKCSSGAPGSRTVRGKFTIGSRGLSFGEDKGYSCWYWTQFYGNYLFHSVLYNPGSKRSLQDGRLGMNLSHGCVRLAIGNAKWINRNIPSGTKVWTY